MNRSNHKLCGLADNRLYFSLKNLNKHNANINSFSTVRALFPLCLEKFENVETVEHPGFNYLADLLRRASFAVLFHLSSVLVCPTQKMKDHRVRGIIFILFLVLPHQAIQYCDRTSSIY